MAPKPSSTPTEAAQQAAVNVGSSARAALPMIASASSHRPLLPQPLSVRQATMGFVVVVGRSARRRRRQQRMGGAPTAAEAATACGRIHNVTRVDSVSQCRAKDHHWYHSTPWHIDDGAKRIYDRWGPTSEAEHAKFVGAARTPTTADSADALARERSRGRPRTEVGLEAVFWAAAHTHKCVGSCRTRLRSNWGPGRPLTWTSTGWTQGR